MWYNFMVIKKHKGFTLIEILVTLAILVLLLLLVDPFTISWSHEASVLEAKSKISQTFLMAKSYSLRNPQAVTQGNVAASIVRNNDIIFVCTGAIALCNDSSALYKAILPNSIIIKNGNNTFVSTTFNNRGIVIDQDNAIYTISKGEVNETFTLR